MEVVSQVVEGKLLNQVIPLPLSLLNVLVEVTVKPASQKDIPPLLTREALRRKLKGSHTQSLAGVLPSVNLSLEELRAERRLRYENLD